MATERSHNPSPTERPSPPDASPSKLSAGRPRILVAEDTPDNQRLLELLLAPLGAELIIVNNGAEALERFQKERFDLVLMDIQMPVMDGEEAAVHIREWEASEAQKSVPLIALTAHAFSEDLAQIYASGFTTHLSKPLHRELLIQTLKHYLPVAEKDSIPNQVEVDPELYVLIPSFLNNRRRDVIRLREMIQGQNFEGVRYLAHTLKGVGGSYGFDHLSELGAHLELAAMSRQTSQCLEIVQSLHQFLQEVKVSVREQ